MMTDEQRILADRQWEEEVMRKPNLGTIVAHIYEDYANHVDLEIITNETLHEERIEKHSWVRDYPTFCTQQILRWAHQGWNIKSETHHEGGRTYRTERLPRIYDESCKQSILYQP